MPSLERKLRTIWWLVFWWVVALAFWLLSGCVVHVHLYERHEAPKPVSGKPTLDGLDSTYLEQQVRNLLRAYTEADGKNE